jgi:hypothetical protein
MDPTDGEAPAEDDGPSLRDSLESSIEQHAPEGGAPEVPEGSVKPEATPLSDQAATEAKARGDRDALGRFLPKTGQEAPQAGPGTPGAIQPRIGQPGAVQAPAQAAPAPASWSPTAREHWASLNPAVQQEVARREADMARYVNETASARNIAERFSQTVSPFMQTIQAEGVDPLTAVRNLMQATTTLRFGTQYEKAQLIAQAVKVYGVDIIGLDSALVGAAPPQGHQQGPDVQAAVQQALAPLYQAAQQRQYQVVQQAEGEARSELDVFAQDPKNEFFGDLRYEMADIIELGEKQGRTITLAQAYERAAMLHPEVSKVMLARQQGASARNLTQNAQRAKAAAVSVRGSAPVGGPVGREPNSIRESIEAAISQHME